MKTDVNVPYLHIGSKNYKKNFKKNSFFVGLLATDENSRIRIRTKISRIHNTE